MAKPLWFAHSCDMRLSGNCVKLRRVEGIEGYGIYMAILERVTSCGARLICNDSNEFYIDIAWEIRTEAQKVKRIVEDYGLFCWTELQDGTGHALSSVGINEEILRFQEEQTARQEHARKAAQARWTAKKVSLQNGDTTPCLENLCPGNARALENNARAMPGNNKNDALLYNNNNNNIVLRHSRKATDEKNFENFSEGKERENAKRDFVEGVAAEWQPPLKKWLEYKSEKGQGYKSVTTLAAAFKRMKELSGGNPQIAMQCVEQSIANNYSGLFALKTQKTPTMGINSISQWN